MLRLSLIFTIFTLLSLNAFAKKSNFEGVYTNSGGTVQISEVNGKTFKFAIKLTAPESCEGIDYSGSAKFTNANSATGFDNESFDFKGNVLKAFIGDDTDIDCKKEFDDVFTKTGAASTTSTKVCSDIACRNKALEADTCAALLGVKTPKDLLKKYGKPSIKKHTVIGGEDDYDFEQWSWWKKSGVKVIIAMEDKSFNYCAVKGSFKGQTARGIKIGSSVDEVTKAYADVMEADSVTSKWIAFHSSEPLKLKYKNKKVTLIRIGYILDAFKSKKKK